jgi:hypothetical protein
MLLEIVDSAYRVGDASLLVKGKPIPPGLLPTVQEPMASGPGGI